MAVAWDDLVQPQGRLNIALLFPADTDDGEERLTGYLADAAANAGALAGAELDAFSTHWSYYRAYLAKYEAELDKAASDQKSLTDQGSKATSKLWSQINGWKELADAEKALADGLLPPVVDAVVATAIPPTTSTPVYYGW